MLISFGFGMAIRQMISRNRTHAYDQLILSIGSIVYVVVYTLKGISGWAPIYFIIISILGILNYKRLTAKIDSQKNNNIEKEV